MLSRAYRRRERLQQWKYNCLVQNKEHEEREEREEQELDTALHLLHPSEGQGRRPGGEAAHVPANARASPECMRLKQEPRKNKVQYDSPALTTPLAAK
jgi:hypothetical protein